jgi:putative ABC transport system permease protein
MVENAIIGLIGTAAGIALGLVILNYVLGVTLPETLPDLGVLPSIGLETAAKAVGLGVVAVALAPLLTARRVRRTDVPSTLRVVE